MANNDNPNGFEAIPLDGTLVKREYLVNDSQTIAKGDPVVLSSGKVSIATATSGQLLGIALEPITTTTATSADKIRVAVAHPNNAFVGQCSGNSAQNLVGTAVDIEGSTGIFEVNENATTEQVIQIIGLHPDDEIGANGRVIFQILRSEFNGLVAAL